jgi:hypothetical protein
MIQKGTPIKVEWTLDRSDLTPAVVFDLPDNTQVTVPMVLFKGFSYQAVYTPALIGALSWNKAVYTDPPTFSIVDGTYPQGSGADQVVDLSGSGAAPPGGFNTAIGFVQGPEASPVGYVQQSPVFGFVEDN